MTTPLALHEQRLGRDDGPVLIMLHGLYGSGSNWRSVAKPFAQSHQVILPDLRNHGRSPHHCDMGYRSMASDVLALMDRHGIANAAVVGHSMGGKVAMTMALQAPERLTHLMVVDIAPVNYDHKSEHGDIIAALQNLDTNNIEDRDDADQALAHAIPKPLVRQFLLTNLQRNADGWSWRIPLQVLADALPELLRWPSDLSGRWHGPTYFVYGGASNYVEPCSRPVIDAHFPAAQYHCLEGVGHWVHAQAPKEFIQQLTHCLAESQ